MSERQVLHSILVLLDGSRFSEYVLPTATSLARASGARLHLLMVHEPALALATPAGARLDLGQDGREVRANQDAYLAAKARELGMAGPNAVTHELIDGIVAPAILRAVAANPPGLIVMSTHGRGPLTRLWLGSVADHLVRHSRVPILLLRPKHGLEAPPPALNLRRILLPLDLSLPSETILEAVRPLASATHAHITLLHVVEPMLGPATAPPYSIALGPEALDAKLVNAERHLAELANDLRTAGLRVATRVELGIGVAAVILKSLEATQFDLVAMSTTGAGGLRRALLGSVVDKVIRGAEKPVLVRRPGDPSPRWND